MRSYDGADTYELVDLYLLSLCTKVIPDLGMYRDDGLAVTRSTARQREKLKQELIKVFQREELRITTEANIHSVNFLDVNLDLKTGLHKPYMKPNSTPLYVHSLSNHPKKILQNVPLAVNERLNRISSNQAVFSEAAPVYQEALYKSGYSHKLSYSPPKDPPQPKKNKSRVLCSLHYMQLSEQYSCLTLQMLSSLYWSHWRYPV